ncbi:hypothetical protein Clacol_003733 [Clathrus columnatus]|uniref:BZIP domain-containing protein n=1 Tax=Clathrus columnatus TaxID=1419009 RepID=A0AAV5A5E3_9AGAM|nr:hypothetical protein Clacol_003733 [Clathrus columnatus]
MSKQPPFQSSHSSHRSKHTPEQPPENYGNERSVFQNPFQHNNDPYFSNIPFSQNTQGVVASHLAYPRTASSSSQWSPIMPHTIPAGYPESPSSGRSDSVTGPATVGGSHSPRQRAVISIPPCQTSSFKVKASRDNVDHPEAEVILEEKRQRNTAASARFRVRKKERNQQLEQTVSHLSTRAEELEREASDLRRENTWLKEIVIMKGRQNLDASSSTSTSTSSTSGPSGQRRGGESDNTNTRSKHDSESSGKGSDSESK